MNIFFCKPAFGVESGFAAHAGGGDRLLVGRIGNVPGGKNALHASQRAEGILQCDETLGIEF